MSELATAVDLPLGMTDLEEALRGPDGAAARSAAVERLEAAIRVLHASMQAGLSPDEHRRAATVREGLAVARMVLLAFPVGQPA